MILRYSVLFVIFALMMIALTVSLLSKPLGV